MLLPRLLTALVGIPAVLYLARAGGVPYLVFAVGAAALALYEYALMLWAGGRGIQRATTVAGGALVALGVALSPAGPAGAGSAHLAVSALLMAAVLREMLRKDHSLDRAAVTVFGALFVGWTLGHLVLLRELSPHGEALTYMLFATVWATDTAAYAAGTAFGRRRLAPVLSPKKSWEGSAAGLAGAAAAAWAVRRWLCPSAMGAPAALGLGLLVGVSSQLSDLAQSLVKRAAGVKDSAALLPGHGGVFDRADAFLLSAPLFYYSAAWTL